MNTNTQSIDAICPIANNFGSKKDIFHVSQVGNDNVKCCCIQHRRSPQRDQSIFDMNFFGTRVHYFSSISQSITSQE